jgi:ATP adenylyltransferase/5',5'''-P-1,P-4-tetraphosphate phosphorylase II
MQFPFVSAESIGDRFISGLQRLLREEHGIGPTILVLNNALLDERVNAAVRDDLSRRFAALAADCRAALAEHRVPDAPADDWEVFRALMTLGLDGIEPLRRRRAGPWQLQFNQVRALRPARTAGERPSANRAPFAAERFHFDKPFLRKEAFWEGTVAGTAVELLYNKFPFVPYHGLLVPERGCRRAQWLERRDHTLAWRLCESSAVPGFGIGYNSYGAFASINHLHFQCFADTRELPVEAVDWYHNGGSLAYPALCQVCIGEAAAWERVDDLQRSGASFNLLYRPDRLYCLARRRQGTQDLPAWSTGLAWLEMSGGFVVADRDAFEALTETDARCVLSDSRSDGDGGVPANRSF